MEDESPFFIGGMWDVWPARAIERIVRPLKDRGIDFFKIRHKGKGSPRACRSP